MSAFCAGHPTTRPSLSEADGFGITAVGSQARQLASKSKRGEGKGSQWKWTCCVQKT